jgi:hypothetical protein
LLGVHIPPDTAHGILQATIGLLFGLLLIGLAVADDAGLGPRHREWRAYWIYRLTRR